ncbi:unnamed protein product (macronuclear) [Paramecium tetraurelia]|uniref:Uncharacterized protein n=1 Tax=Paramecium tetraurelia TaxID=5888 RepID=A0CTM5_PARTE|nr:uncharacterized protein GSPATT00010376001 [Paramecium tetraurelia]CAK74142.1 unnamed protein product [Paramecium tetraurelia]|eukprot:XP_001441539.1 hypothetical protein (macronuclear) [Paramecium tetraurelia strain d4-2]
MKYHIFKYIIQQFNLEINDQQEKVLQMNKKLQMIKICKLNRPIKPKKLSEEIFNFPPFICQINAYSKQIKEFELTIIKKINKLKIQKETPETRFTEIQIQFQVIQKEHKELLKNYPALMHLSYDELNKDNIYLSKQLYENQQLIQQQNVKFKRLEAELHQMRQQTEKEKMAQLEKKIYDLEQQLQKKDFYHNKDIDNLHLVIAILKDYPILIRERRKEAISACD